MYCWLDWVVRWQQLDEKRQSFLYMLLHKCLLSSALKDQVNTDLSIQKLVNKSKKKKKTSKNHKKTNHKQKTTNKQTSKKTPHHHNANYPFCLIEKKWSSDMRQKVTRETMFFAVLFYARTFYACNKISRKYSKRLTVHMRCLTQVRNCTFF